MNPLPRTTAKLPRLLRKTVAFILTLALAVLVLMFSAVLLAVIALVGTLAGGYLWWKTREMRKQMREFSARNRRGEEVEGEVFEGEVVSVEVPANRKIQ